MSSRHSRGSLIALGLVVALCAHHGVPRALGQLGADDPNDRRHAPRTALNRPWVPRHRQGVIAESENADAAVAEPGALTNARLRALGLRGGRRTQIPVASWPPEPPSPGQIDALRFSAALSCLCPRDVPESTVARITTATLAASHTYQVDAFLLAALAFHQSRCQAATRDSYGVGVTRLNVGMHSAHVRGGAYHYGLPTGDGSFVRATLAVGDGALGMRQLLDPESNLAFAAAMLRVFTNQCPTIDAHFGSVPHRHPVSHLIFGDEVRSALPEAMVFTARRRLLTYYDAQPTSMCMECEPAQSRRRKRLRAQSSGRAQVPSLEQRATFSAPLRSVLTSPLDGAPRIVIGVLGDDRDNGARKHAGIDLLASEGEPVRAIQEGVVISAGVDLRKHGLVDMPPSRALLVPLSRMGARGIFVRVEHPSGVTSIYAHLADYVVEVGQHVTGGQLLGTIGRTGVQTSDAHLHLGLFDQGRVLDPLVHLDRYVLSVDRGTPLE